MDGWISEVDGEMGKWADGGMCGELVGWVGIQGNGWMSV